MKKLTIASTIAALIATPALAADMAVKASPPRAATWSWSGCYVGVNGGVGWNNGRTHYDDPNATPDPINFVTGGFTGVTFIPTPSGTGGVGGLGGGGGGCNWQSQQWVYGVEGDIDIGHIAGSQTNSITPPLLGIGVSPTDTLFGATVTASENTELNWLSTIRGRIGFALRDRLLLFTTGGLAVGEAHSEGSVIVSNNKAGQIVWAGSHSSVKAGFVVGGGAEWAFADRWTAKTEYLWYDLGDISHSLACTSGGLATVPFTTCTSTPGLFPTLGNAVSSIHGSIVRFGINYKFN